MRAIGLMAIVLLTGCGGADEGANTTTASDEASATTSAPVTKSDDAKMKAALAKPCEFVPGDAIGKAMGTTVDRASAIAAKDPDDTNASCNYGLADGGFVNVDITYNHLNPAYYDAAEIESRKGFLATGDKPAEDVPGVGDTAFWSSNPKNFQLYVYRGGAEQVSFGPSKMKNGGEKEAAIAMAKAAGY